MTASPAAPRQRMSNRLTFAFGDVARRGDVGGLFVAPIDVVFAPGVVPVPDLVFVRQDRLGIVGDKAVEGAPDLIVETLSPSTRGRDQDIKPALDERFGVRGTWLLDPPMRGAAVFVLRDGRYEPHPIADGVVRSTVIPGLGVKVAALFDVS